MACPKTNPNYPNTATLIEIPFDVIVRRVDRDFDKERRFDLAYEFQKRLFREDAVLHGAYVPATYSFDASFDASFDTFVAALSIQNGFCGS